MSQEVSQSSQADRKLETSNHDNWQEASSTNVVNTTTKQFLEITDLLLEQVQLNSTHLFRADILHDTSHKLQTLAEKEASCKVANEAVDCESIENDGNSSLRADGICPLLFTDFEHQRTVVRRLIPRKPQLDKPLEQSCFIYDNTTTQSEEYNLKEILVVYVPHCSSSDQMPWYHPKVKALAYLFSEKANNLASLSVYYLAFDDTPAPPSDRLQRTMHSLLHTLVRLLKMPPKSGAQPHTKIPRCEDPITMPLTPAALKDTVLPQHIVQDTYTYLKQTYASDLISRWVESTEPSKHVFEDLSIAAFLIELWKTMYRQSTFPGFVDIACGNGVLTYILAKEGWRGVGFDARRRKTWEILDIEQHLEEKICIPEPFLEVADTSDLQEIVIHNGMFAPNTFIISNHADELTCWTSILAAISCPESPLPFLAIPCCSHALDGSRYRYTPKDISPSASSEKSTRDKHDSNQDQPSTGSLIALRTSRSHEHKESQYACLTRKTACLARDLGASVELTLMRIPSTRNIGIVGNRRSVTRRDYGQDQDQDKISQQEHEDKEDKKTESLKRIREVVSRECSATGGVEVSARTWIEKAKKLQGGQGRGKVNWKCSVRSTKEIE